MKWFASSSLLLVLLSLGCGSGDKKQAPGSDYAGTAPPPPNSAKAIAERKAQDEEENDPLFKANRHYANGDLESAIKEVRDELVRNPDNGRARYFYAVFLIDKGELRGAAIELQHTIALNPRDVPIVIAWTRLGEIRERLGEHQAALEAYLKAIDAEREAESKAATSQKGGAPPA
ncbi:MAG: tetratricopeptide repeat protein, partial [Planctomycetota bacterium]